MRKLAEWLYMKNSRNLRRVWPTISCTWCLSRSSLKASLYCRINSIFHCVLHFCKQCWYKLTERFIVKCKRVSWCNEICRMNTTVLGCLFWLVVGWGAHTYFKRDRYSVHNKVQRLDSRSAAGCGSRPASRRASGYKFCLSPGTPQHWSHAVMKIPTQESRLTLEIFAELCGCRRADFKRTESVTFISVCILWRRECAPLWFICGPPFSWNCAVSLLTSRFEVLVRATFFIVMYFSLQIVYRGNKTLFIIFVHRIPNIKMWQRLSRS